jgi:hypothetical protein
MLSDWPVLQWLPVPVPFPQDEVQDLIEHFSPKHFRHYTRYSREVLQNCLSTQKATDLDNARVKLLRYTDILLARSEAWVDKEPDLLAAVVRNLIELLFWARYITQGDEYLKLFLRDAEIDARELHDKLQHIGGPLTLPDGVTIPDAGKRVTIERANAHEAMIYKLCSKYIHPSSYFLNHLDEIISDDNNHKVFCSAVILYSWEIIGEFHNFEFEDAT